MPAASLPTWTTRPLGPLSVALAALVIAGCGGDDAASSSASGGAGAVSASGTSMSGAQGGSSSGTDATTGSGAGQGGGVGSGGAGSGGAGSGGSSGAGGDIGADGWPDVTLPTIEGATYLLELDRWGLYADGTHAEENTDNLQEAIDWASGEGYGGFQIPAGTYLIGTIVNDAYAGGIELKSGMALLLDDGAVLQMAPNDRWNYCVVRISDQTDVAIVGGAIYGDRDDHVFSPRPEDGATAHDEGHTVCVEGASKRILIDSVELAEATGDGVLLVGNPGRPEDVTIVGSELHDNRRQGVSVVGAERVRIEGNEIHHIEGTSPQFGIDVEPLGGYVARDLIFRGNSFHHNRGGDIVNTAGLHVLIEGNDLSQGDLGERYIDGPLVFWPASDQTVRGNTITMLEGSVNGRSGIIGYSSEGTQRANPDPNIIEDNTCNGCGIYLYSTARAELRRNHFLEGYIVVQNFEDLTLEDNEVTNPDRCWAYRFKNVTGRASGNTYNGQAFDVPLSDEPYDGCWVN